MVVEPGRVHCDGRRVGVVPSHRAHVHSYGGADAARRWFDTRVLIAAYCCWTPRPSLFFGSLLTLVVLDGTAAVSLLDWAEPFSCHESLARTRLDRYGRPCPRVRRPHCCVAGRWPDLPVGRLLPSCLQAFLCPTQALKLGMVTATPQVFASPAPCPSPWISLASPCHQRCLGIVRGSVHVAVGAQVRAGRLWATACVPELATVEGAGKRWGQGVRDQSHSRCSRWSRGPGYPCTWPDCCTKPPNHFLLRRGILTV